MFEALLTELLTTLPTFPLLHRAGATYLLGTMHLLVVVQVSARQGRAHDGQTFAGLQLVGERQEARLLHILLAVRADQHQQLWAFILI